MFNSKILIVDDEAWFTEPIIERLEYYGFEVSYCKNIAKGLSSFEKSYGTSDEFRAVIVDLMLPYGKLEVKDTEKEEIPGLYLLKKLRDIDPDIPIFCYTVVDDPTVIEQEVIGKYHARHFAKASSDDENLFRELRELFNSIPQETN